MAPIERKKRLHMLLSEEEETTLQALAEDDGLTVSDYIRQLIRREGEARRPKSLGEAAMKYLKKKR